MILIIIIAFISLIGLLVIHEFGHFILAKRFGAKVEEFGIGLPPRIYGKKIGETIYSINLIPFGAFVKILGEEGGIEGVRSFSNKPMYQRMLIILGGVVAFWIVSWILLSIVMVIGMPSMVTDEQNTNLVNPNVQIVAVAPNSPAQEQDIEIGDMIVKIKSSDKELETTKTKPIIEFINEHKGEEVVITLKRGERIFDAPVVPRVSPPEGEGSLGVALIRTAIKSYPIYEAPIRGAIETGNLTIGAVQGWIMVGSNVIKGQGMPPGAELMGPIGIFGLFTKMSVLESLDCSQR
jgi:regulator of sigma E protease